MYMIIFIAAIAVAALVFEIMTALTESAMGRGRLADFRTAAGIEIASSRRRSSLDAILLAMWPERFDPSTAKNMLDVVDMLRRAGYPYETPGEFYAAAIRDFIVYLVVGAGLAAVLVIFDMGFAGPILAAIFIFLGLRRPYARLKMLAKRRAEGIVSNMLIGLSVMETLIVSGVTMEPALRAVGSLGGPFCNLMALLLAQRSIKNASEAIEVVRQHLPDPGNMEVQLFLNDIEREFTQEGSGRLGDSVRALRQSLHRTVVETTETRAALVRQRAGLFGVLAVLGLVLTIVLPYMGIAF
jgi:Flp pilus assembly protein TadB